MGYFFTEASPSGDTPAVGKLPEPVFEKDEFAGRKIHFISAEGYGANLPQLQDNAMGAGHFATTPDPDGVVRRVPMLYEYQDNYYESLSLAVARRIRQGQGSSGRSWWT